MRSPAFRSAGVPPGLPPGPAGAITLSCLSAAKHLLFLLPSYTRRFSVGRLMEFLTALRQDVEITVRPTRNQRGALSVISP
jgi:hypothetical protein